MTVLGDGKCPLCGHPVTISDSKSAKPYMTCAHPDDGGCGSQIFTRYEKGAGILARQIKKWRDPEMRKRYNGTDEDEAQERAPEVEGKGKPRSTPKGGAKRGAMPRKPPPVDLDERPEPPVNVKPKASFWDREI